MRDNDVREWENDIKEWYQGNGGKKMSVYDIKEER